MDMKTCPGAMSFVGEHSNPLEEWRETALRGIAEELGLTSLALLPVDLTPGHSILVQTSYTELGKKEPQATKLFLVRLLAEVAAMHWLPLQNVSTLLDERTSAGAAAANVFCN